MLGFFLLELFLHFHEVGVSVLRCRTFKNGLFAAFRLLGLRLPLRVRICNSKPQKQQAFRDPGVGGHPDAGLGVRQRGELALSCEDLVISVPLGFVLPCPALVVLDQSCELLFFLEKLAAGHHIIRHIEYDQLALVLEELGLKTQHFWLVVGEGQ